MEFKRMFVSSNDRNKGVASQILKELEKWAKELNYSKCILETGNHVVNFYKKNGYQIIPNYDQYIGMESSICCEKNMLW
jgi:putative acetyltransferase